MKVFIVITTIVLIFSVFLGNANSAIANPLLSYLLYVINMIISYSPLLIIIFTIMFIFFLKKNYTKDRLKLHTLFHNFTQIIFALIISIFSAFVILLVIALIELNIFSVLVNLNPGALGIKAKTDEIYNDLKNKSQAPKIVLGNSGSKNIVVALAKTAGGTDNLYSDRLINIIPNLFIFPINEDSYSLLLMDNTLIVNSINPKDIEKISSVLGFLYIKNNFPLRAVKSYPKVSIMDENTFLTFRQKDLEEKTKKIDKEILKIQNAVSSVSASVELDKIDVENNKLESGNILKARDKEYNACLSEGSYVKGKFIPINTESFCGEILKKWETDYVISENTGKELTKKIEAKEKNLKEYQYFDNYFKAYKKLNDASSLNIPSELGVFEPKDNIRIVFMNTSQTNIADYFETLIHEYLHYASYNEGGKLESSFFEEGLTAYFARQTIENGMNIKTNIGYPVAVKVIEALLKRSVEVDLAEIYFTKDQDSLEKKLDQVYGDGFYKNNIIQFESLLYISNPDLLLSTANSLMRKVGGDPLTKEDIVSTKSDIN